MDETKLLEYVLSEGLRDEPPAPPSTNEDPLLVVKEEESVKETNIPDDNGPMEQDKHLDDECLDADVLKKKLDRILMRNQQYKRRIESLTDALIDLRYTKRLLEEEIHSAKSQ